MTGFEPATSSFAGMHSNPLSYMALMLVVQLTKVSREIKSIVLSTKLFFDQFILCLLVHQTSRTICIMNLIRFTSNLKQETTLCHTRNSVILLVDINKQSSEISFRQNKLNYRKLNRSIFCVKRGDTHLKIHLTT